MQGNKPSPQEAQAPLGRAALKLASRGLRVFPCIERSKQPAIADNLTRATTDPGIIRGWWRSRDFNIGIATGPDSGIWVLDIDGGEGEVLMRQLEAQYGPLPATVEAITGDGRHLYFRWPTGCDIRNRQGDPVLPYVDVRGDGGYVLAPPSAHPSGRRYSWSVDSASNFADAPDWLIELVTARGGTSKATTTPEAWRSFIKEPVEGSHRAHAIARLYGLLVRRFLDPIVALDVVRMFNELRCKPPLDDWEVVRVADNIARRKLIAARDCDHGTTEFRHRSPHRNRQTAKE